MDSYLLSKERVDDKFQWMCEGPSCTGILAGCDKIRNVVKCPEVLVLHLVRWAEDGSPLQHHVEAEQCIKVLRGGESEAYTLTGVVCRQGEQAESGHYYSFALHNGNGICTTMHCGRKPHHLRFEATEPNGCVVSHTCCSTKRGRVQRLHRQRRRALPATPRRLDKPVPQGI